MSDTVAVQNAVEMKLVGAATFSSPKVDNRRTITKGEVVSVDPMTAEYLAGLTYLDAANNEFPIWVKKGERVRSRAVKVAEETDEDEDSALPAQRRARAGKK